MFLDPLKKVTSSTVVDKFLLLCSTNEQRCFLQALGMKIGIKPWIDDFMDKHKATSQETSIRTSHSTLDKVSIVTIIYLKYMYNWILFNLRFFQIRLNLH